MRYHPAYLMLIVWLSAYAAFVILPFQLTHRTISLEGTLILLAFLILFCFGSLARTVYVPQNPIGSTIDLDFRRVDFILKTLSLIAIVTMGLDIVRGSGLNLGSAYGQRSSQAQALLHGALSQSSGLFKLGFICYPAGYVFICRSILLEAKPKWGQVFLFGLLPVALAGLAMGGRAPIFNGLAYGLLAYRARHILYRPRTKKQPKVRKIHPVVRILAIFIGVLAFNYFINVFIVRAEIVGGAEAMLEIVASQWGVTFAGPRADLFINVFGAVTTYIIFVFVWYLIQGIVMSNSIFVNFDGDAMLGIYGIDILTAIMRRIDPNGVSQSFTYLLNLDTYGFLPSAFGSLFVDFRFGGLVAVFIWGWLASVVYRNTRRGIDPRWFIFSPFITLGIVFSLVNTPVGFSNGFITHFWLVISFFLIRRPKLRDGT